MNTPGSAPQVGSILTPREFEIIGWAAQGKTAWEIGRIIERDESTVKKHLQHIYRKLGVHKLTAALNRLRELGYDC